MKTTIRLEDWCVLMSGDNYTPPELQSQRLNGVPVNDPRFTGNKRITTSDIVGQRDGCVVTNSGTLYKLGTVRPDYEKRFPGASEKLFSTLNRI